MSEMLADTLFVDTEAGLSKLCEQLRGKPVLVLDTEFLREKTYYAQLCLIQVAAEGVIACVDPLAINIDPLLDIIYDPNVVKVMHSARQDLEILFDLRGDLPRPLFDSQVAATLMGFGEQIGYANLVQQMLGVELDKMHTRTDWSQRPLDDEQLRYAADDVRYLFTVYHQQVETLRRKGRIDWLQEDFNELTNLDAYAPPPEVLWKRVRGAQKLKPAQLAVLRGLAVWREERARKINRPRRWVLKDEVMVDIARRGPRKLADLEKIRGLEGKILHQHGDDLLKVIADEQASDSSAWPTRPSSRRLTPAQDALVDLLMAVVRIRGAENEVSPGLLANRKAVESLVAGEVGVSVLHGWRAELAGHDLQAILAGERLLRVENGQLVIESAFAKK